MKLYQKRSLCFRLKGAITPYFGVFRGNLLLITSLKLVNGDAEFLYIKKDDSEQNDLYPGDLL